MWPHLLIEEFVALLVVSAFLIVFSTFVNAPLLELANPNLTPNPSKAPWYFMGLQELLRYFHPTIAGVMMPTVAIIALIVIPYFDRNPSDEARRPQDRHHAVHDVHHVLGDPGHDRFVLPRPGAELGVAVDSGPLLRPVTCSAISQSTFAILVVGALFGLFLLLLAGSFVRARQAAAAAAGRAGRRDGRRPPSRCRAATSSGAGSCCRASASSLAQFGGATLAFLYPNLKGGFGSTINAGSLDEIRNAIQSTRQPYYLGSGRFYLVAYDVDPLPEDYVGHRGGRPDGAVPAVRPPRLPGPVLRAVPVVRVPVPRLEVQPGRRVPVRAGAQGPGPVPDRDLGDIGRGRHRPP